MQIVCILVLIISVAIIAGERLKRSGQSTTALPDGRILLFGGINDDGRFCNDAHIISLDNLESFSLKKIIRGAPPKPRAYHT